MVTQITEITANPDINDPGNFESEMSNWVTQQKATIVEQNTQALEVNEFALNAEAAAGALANAKWVSGSYTEGNVVWSPTNYYNYRAKTTGSLTTDPASDPTNWALLTKTSNGGGDEKSSATDITLLSTDARVQSITITASGKTVNLPAPGALEEGLVFIIKNAGEYDFKVHSNAGKLYALVPPLATVSMSLIDNTTDLWLAENSSTNPRVLAPVTLNRDIINASNVSSTAIAKLSNTKYLASYFETSGSKLYVVAFTTTVSGDIDSVGTPVQITNANSSSHDLEGFDVSNAAIAYLDSTPNLKVVALSISGTTITVDGTPATVRATVSGGAVRLTKIDSAKLSLVYAHSLSIFGRVITLSAGSAVANAEITVSSTPSANPSEYEMDQKLIDTDLMAVTYDTSATASAMILLDVSTTTPSKGNELTNSSGKSESMVLLSSGEIARFFFNSSNDFYYRIDSYSGTTLTNVLGNVFLFSAKLTSTDMTAIKTSDGQIILFTKYATYRLIENRTPQFLRFEEANNIYNVERVFPLRIDAVPSVNNKILLANTTNINYLQIDEIEVPA